MCRNTFLSMIFSFIFISAFFGLMANEAIQEPSATPNAFDLTATSLIATATAQAQIDPFALTATSIIDTVTAQAQLTNSGVVKPSTTPENFGATATALIQAATANAQNYPTLDPFSMTATAIVANATGQGQPYQTPDFGLTATSLIQTATANAQPIQPSQTIDPFALTATSIIRTATAEAQPTQVIGSPDEFELTATAIIETVTAMAQPTMIASPDEFDLTATSIVATATANALPSQQFLPYPYTATAAAQTQAAIATASPTPCEGFEWTFTYFAAEATYGIDAYELTERVCSNTDFTLYAFEISIMDASGSLSDEDFYMLFDSVIGNFAEFPEEYPLRKPDISELILLTNFNTMQSWEFTYTDAVNAWDDDLRGEQLAEVLGVILH